MRTPGRRAAWRIVLAALAVLVAFAIAWREASRASPEAIRAELRSIAPLGSDVERVKAAIRSRYGAAAGSSWNVDRHGRVTELIARRGSTFRFRPGRFPWPTIIYGHWHFDENGRLADVGARYYVERLMGAEEVSGP